MQASSSAVNATLSIQACSGSSLQKWNFFDANREVRLNGTNLCVEIPGGNTALGTLPKLATCNSGANQTFTFSASDIRFSNRCFAVLGGVTTPGAGVALWDGCDVNPPLPHEQFTIRGQVKSLGQCVDMSGQAGFDGVPIGVAPCSAAQSQIWEYFW